MAFAGIDPDELLPKNCPVASLGGLRDAGIPLVVSDVEHAAEPTHSPRQAVEREAVLPLGG